MIYDKSVSTVYQVNETNWRCLCVTCVKCYDVQSTYETKTKTDATFKMFVHQLSFSSLIQVLSFKASLIDGDFFKAKVVQFLQFILLLIIYAKIHSRSAV